MNINLDSEIDLIRTCAMANATLDIVSDEFMVYAEIYSKIQEEADRIRKIPVEHKNVLTGTPEEIRFYENFRQKVIYQHNESNPVVIYGAGKMGMFVASSFINGGCDNIVALCDNGTPKTEYLGKPVLRHDDCINQYPDAVYVITVQQRYIEIIDNLFRSGIPRSRIAVFDRLGNNFIYNP